MLRIILVKSLVSTLQMQSVYYSSGLSKEQLLRIRTDQKQLYGNIIRGDTKPSIENVKKKTKERRKVEGEEDNEFFGNKIAELKASKPSQSCEFYWLIQCGDSKNVKIFRSKDVNIDEDVLSTKHKFKESPSSNETS